MTDNVIPWGGVTKLPIAPDDILDRSKGKYERVVVIGISSDGRLNIAASEADLVICNFDIDRAKAWIMREVADAPPPMEG